MSRPESREELITEIELLKHNMNKCVFCKHCREEMAELMKRLPKENGK